MTVTPDNDWLIDQLPWKLDIPSAIATFAIYEAHKKLITLKNGNKVMPEGWLSFVGMKAEDLKGEKVE